MTTTTNTANRLQTTPSEQPKDLLEGATFGSKTAAVAQQQQTPQQRYEGMRLPENSAFQEQGNVAGNIRFLGELHTTYPGVPAGIRASHYLPTFGVALRHGDRTVRAEAIRILTDIGTNHNDTVPPEIRAALTWRLTQVSRDPNQTQQDRDAAAAAVTALRPLQ